MMKKRGNENGGRPDLERLNPLITIEEEDGESLFAIVDFTLPDDDRVRRIISKRNGNGTITAVVYLGKVGPDRTCCKKTHILEMKNATEEEFWTTVKILETVYLARGGRVEIRNYKGKTIREATDLMRRLDCAKVWTHGDTPHNL